MFCTRCGLMIPDFLWVGNDHPVLAGKNIVVFRDDDIERDVLRITARVEVKRINCSDKFKVTEMGKVKIVNEGIGWPGDG